MTDIPYAPPLSPTPTPPRTSRSAMTSTTTVVASIASSSVATSHEQVSSSYTQRLETVFNDTPPFDARHWPRVLTLMILSYIPPPANPFIILDDILYHQSKKRLSYNRITAVITRNTTINYDDKQQQQQQQRRYDRWVDLPPLIPSYTIPQGGGRASFYIVNDVYIYHIGTHSMTGSVRVNRLLLSTIYSNSSGSNNGTTLSSSLVTSPPMAALDSLPLPPSPSLSFNKAMSHPTLAQMEALCQWQTISTLSERVKYGMTHTVRYDNDPNRLLIIAHHPRCEHNTYQPHLYALPYHVYNIQTNEWSILPLPSASQYNHGDDIYVTSVTVYHGDVYIFGRYRYRTFAEKRRSRYRTSADNGENGDIYVTIDGHYDHRCNQWHFCNISSATLNLIINQTSSTMVCPIITNR
jgi:hypothetical protein